MSGKPSVYIDLDLRKVRQLLVGDGGMVVGGNGGQMVIYVVREHGEDVDLEVVLLADGDQVVLLEAKP